MDVATISLPLPRYTVGDLERFPDDGDRYELLEGWLLAKPSPGSAHQWLVVRLATALDVRPESGRAGFVYPGGGAQHGISTLLIPEA